MTKGLRLFGFRFANAYSGRGAGARARAGPSDRNTDKRKVCRMGEDRRDPVVVDVADALTLDQDVDWDRCAREAAPASRRTLENLRLVADLLAHFRAPGDTAAASALPGGVAVRFAVRALIAVSALWAAASLMAGLWGWEEFRRENRDLTLYLTLWVAGAAATGCLFLFAGRRERRTWLLGGYFLVSAALVNPFALLGFLRGAPPVEPFGYPDFAFPYFYPFMFAPAFLWAFARECPQVHRGTRLDGLARRMVPVSVLVGGLLGAAVVTWLLLARAGHVPLAVSWVMFDGMFVVLNALSLSAVVVIVLRARTAGADETRRVVLFSIGFLLYIGLTAAYNVAAAITAGDWLSNYQWSPVITVQQLLRFPGLLLLWYAVLAARVPHPREVVRASLERLLARGWLLAAGSAAAAAALGWRLAGRLDQELGAVAADPVVQSLGAVALFLLLTAAARGQLRARLDAWLYPDTADQRQILADAAAALAKVGRAARVSRIVRRTAKRGCGTPVTLLARTAAAPEARGLDDPDGDMPPLARASAIVHLLETAGGTLRVHPQDEASYFHVLLDDDRRWVVESGADAIVPVPGPGVELLGVLVAGRRLDGRLARPVDVPFLEALGASAGLALVRVLATTMAAAGSLDPPAAEECPACGCVSEAGEPAACDCGAAYVETAGPKLLAGKYRLMRRLGQGGDGGGVSGARPAARAGRRRQGLDGRVGLRPDGVEAGGVGHGHGDAPGGGADPRHRVVAGPPVSRRRAPAARHPRRPAAARSGARAPRPRHRRPAGRRPRGRARGGVSARRHQAEQRRVRVGRLAEAAGLRSGPGGERRHQRGGHAALPVARGAVGAGCRRKRRRLVAVRDAVRDGLGRASVCGGRRRRGAGAHSAPASRPGRSRCGLRPVGGRAHGRGVGADGSPAGAAGYRARLRRRASTRPPRAPGAGRSMSFQTPLL